VRLQVIKCYVAEDSDLAVCDAGLLYPEDGETMIL
jgi:hypothetical protein